MDLILFKMREKDNKKDKPENNPNSNIPLVEKDPKLKAELDLPEDKTFNFFYDTSYYDDNIDDDNIDTIYLAIDTNINCVERKYGLFMERLGIFRGPDDFRRFTSIVDTIPNLSIYLGKIIFKDNGTKVPQYIPSKLTKENLENIIDTLNPLWLNDINPQAESFDEMRRDLSKFSRAYEKVYERGPRQFFDRYIALTPKHYDINITLNKEQIISYVTELHTSNTNAIKTYIDTINKEGGIRGYYIYDELIDKFNKLGIFDKEQTININGANVRVKKILIALDYLKQTNQHRIIPYFDELFYWYLVASLNRYIFLNLEGKWQDKSKLLFNPVAYKKYADAVISENKQERPPFMFFYFSYESYLEKYGSKFNSQFGYPETNSWYQANGTQVYEPYIVSSYDNYIDAPVINNHFPPIYFEQGSNRGTYIDVYNPIYPSITKPPKGWTKEMMKKLELQLDLDMYKP